MFILDLLLRFDWNSAMSTEESSFVYGDPGVMISGRRQCWLDLSHYMHVLRPSSELVQLATWLACILRAYRPGSYLDK